MNTPVIFLSFANDQTEHLPFLKEESRSIYRALQSLHDKRFIEIYREESADIDGLFEDFNRFKDRLVIFHYSGHAGSKQLRLEGQAAGAEGLAGLFSEQKDTLRLVFLNGCSTLAQVADLHRLGVKAVIATSSPVADSKAFDFAVAFYKALSNHSTLEQSFQRAVNLLKTKYQEQAPVATIQTRSIGVEETSAELAWGLYVRAGDDSVLQWKLPQISVTPPREVPPGYQVNQGILDILAAMEKHNPAIFIQEPRARERKAPVTIRENFPWPMSAQIRMLFANTESMNRHGMPRLRQLIESYVATTRFLAFSMLSQLWDSQYEKSDLKGLDMEDLTHATFDNHRFYDYLHLLRNCHDILLQNNITPFITEISASIARISEGGSSFENYRFIESVRLRLLNQEIAENEVAKLCTECEAVLTELLVNAAFLSKYKLLTIKDIKVFSPKRLAREFIHHYAELNTVSREDIWVDDLPLPKPTNSHSVLLTPRNEPEEIVRYLDLSPFVIDKSTFMGAQSPAIYVFLYAQDGILYFQSVDTDVNVLPNESDILRIDSGMKEYELLWNQFDLFTKDQTQ